MQFTTEDWHWRSGKNSGPAIKKNSLLFPFLRPKDAPSPFWAIFESVDALNSRKDRKNILNEFGQQIEDGSSCGVIVRVTVVLKRTVVGD